LHHGAGDRNAEKEQWRQGGDEDTACEDGAGMGANFVGMEWGCGQEQRRRLGMGTVQLSNTCIPEIEASVDMDICPWIST